MKNINFKATLISFVVAFVTAFALTACGGGETVTEEVATEEVVACADDCQKACCLGCKATEGEVKCIVAEDGSMPCCIAKEEAVCCCGNAECAGPETCPKHQEDDDGHDHDHDGHVHE